MSYHITGAISSLIFLLTLTGLWSQLQLVWDRKARFSKGSLRQRPTAILSLNQFVSSFLAFFSFLIYGACLQPFNHYLVWTRLLACVLTVSVLYEILADLRDRSSTAAVVGCSVLFLGLPLLLAMGEHRVKFGRILSQGFILVVTAVLVQGYAHQVLLIRRSGHTGAVSLRMHQFFLLKDVSTIAFAATMGIANGWPVLLASAVSGSTKLVIMWHFRWARTSSVARERRSAGECHLEPVYTIGA